MSENPADLTASELVAAFKAGTFSAREIASASLARIAERDPSLGAFTDILTDRALKTAQKIDEKRLRQQPLGALAGVPFAVKNLYDIQGLPTRAGSKINRDMPPATHDAALLARLEAEDAILIGGLNMGEYAYDFTGENAHDGPSRNPHAIAHMAGGSSGGSGAAVASGMVPLALGSDTNGSIRVPSSFCGLFGLKPTYGRLSRAGTFPFVASFDHLGPFARSVGDLALAYDAMQGTDPDDPAQAHVATQLTTPSLHQPISELRMATLGGYFHQLASDSARQAVARVAAALNVTAQVEFPQAARARSAGYLITMTEGAALHLERLQTRRDDFDPDVSNRLIAGAMLPAAWTVQAQKFRGWFRSQVATIFENHDILLAPATPYRAPLIGQKTVVVDGEEQLVRPNIGIFTQPISFIGLPVVTVPIWTPGITLPIGVQIIGAPWCEDKVLRVADVLQMQGICHAPIAPFTASIPAK